MTAMHSRLVSILLLVLLGTSAGLVLAHDGIADHGESCQVCLLAHAAHADLVPSAGLVPGVGMTTPCPEPPLLPARGGTPREASPRAPPAS